MTFPLLPLFFASTGLGASPGEASSPENLALNTAGSGYPSPLESDSGWGGGSYPWQIVDGIRTYADEWARIVMGSDQFN